MELESWHWGLKRGMEVGNRTEQGWSAGTGASPAAGFFPVEVNWPAPEVEVVVGELPLWWAGREGVRD